MNIFLLGLNHKTTPLSLREKIAFSHHKLTEAIISLSGYPHISECVIISTCNRVEFYVVSSSNRCYDEIRQFIYSFHRLKEDLSSYFYFYCGKEAVRHLFRVVSSLDSMVIGENQILGQIKDAYCSAQRCEAVRRTLSLLFENTLKLGKYVRTYTEIGKGAVSISTAAIELVRKVMGSLKDKRALIIGMGKVGEILLRNLVSRGIKTICVANRTYQKAAYLARVFKGEAIRFDALEEALVTADIVVSSTSAPHIIIRKEVILKVMKKRDKPLFLVDLGVPRNIEKGTAAIKNVYFYDIDDLMSVREKNITRRLREVQKVNKIIDNSVDRFMIKLNCVKCPTNG